MTGSALGARLSAYDSTAAPATTIGQPNSVAMGFFFLFIAITLGITWWAARRTRTTEQFYAAGRTVSAVQNGFALAGDYMSAASFLGIAGLVATTSANVYLPRLRSGSATRKSTTGHPTSQPVE